MVYGVMKKQSSIYSMGLWNNSFLLDDDLQRLMRYSSMTAT